MPATPIDRDAPDALPVVDVDEEELLVLVPEPEPVVFEVVLVPFKAIALALKAVKFLAPLSTALL